jgi:hypothetical protein
MRKRKHLVWVLGLALALGVSAVAVGAGNTDNTQEMAVTVTSSKQSKTKFGNVKLRSLTTTGTTASGNFAITPVDKATIYYDKDIKFDTKGLPQCSKSLAGLTTAQAKARCGKAIVGKGAAVVKIAGNPAVPDTATSITAFNGKPVGGKPVILLHVYSETLGTSAVQVLVGKLNKIKGKYGWRLDVTVPQLPAGTATTIFDVTVTHKPWTTKKTVRRHGHRVTVKTKHLYVSAKCSHGKWFYKGTFHYSSNGGPDKSGSLPASNSQNCSVK